MQIAVNLPNDFVDFQLAADIEKEMRLSYSLWLLKNARVTLSKAAELAGIDIYEFIDRLLVDAKSKPPGKNISNFQGWVYAILKTENLKQVQAEIERQEKEEKRGDGIISKIGVVCFDKEGVTQTELLDAVFGAGASQKYKLK